MIPRLYVQAALAAGTEIALTPAQAHYLRHVLRLGRGGALHLFNGRDGEWAASIVEQGKKAATATVDESLRPQTPEPAIMLLFAPLKRGPIEYLTEKATELGVTCLQPVTTQRTVNQRVNLERMQAHTTEAAEQCGRLSVPEVRPTLPLDAVLESWPENEVLMFCDERGGPPMLNALLRSPRLPAALLIGPEGGFDPRERERLLDHPGVRPISLGPRILRAETAAAVALALWQSVHEHGSA